MNETKIFEIIRNNIIDILPGVDAAQITLAHSLKELGANSIDRMEIVVATMEAIGVKMPLTELARVENIQGLVAVLSAKNA